MLFTDQQFCNRWEKDKLYKRKLKMYMDPTYLNKDVSAESF